MIGQENRVALLCRVRSALPAAVSLLCLGILLLSCSSEKECTYDTDCSGNKSCIDGKCVIHYPQDCPDRKCAEGFFCIDDTCVELACLEVNCPEGEACAGGKCYPEDCGKRTCPGLGEVCIDEDCVQRTCVGVSCPEGQRCANGYCYPENCTEVGCFGEGEVCVDGVCQRISCLGVDCPEGYRCANGWCYPADCAAEDCSDFGEVCYEGKCEESEKEIRELRKEHPVKARLMEKGLANDHGIFSGYRKQSEWLQDAGDKLESLRSDPDLRAKAERIAHEHNSKFEGAKTEMKVLREDFEKGEKLIPEVVIEKCRQLEKIADRPEMKMKDFLKEFPEVKDARSKVGSTLVLLRAPPGIPGGHVDTFARFSDAGTVLLAEVDDSESAEDAEALGWNAELLRSLKRNSESQIRVVRVPIGPMNGRTVPLYLNYLLAGDLVLVPHSGQSDASTDRAVAVLREEMPGYDVRPFNAFELVVENGGLRCASLTIP